jgi:site-specific DNA-methyltransferase (adenine-specific)
MNKFISEVTNEDCMEGMARYPDKYFDLAIVDPPYGIGEDGGKNHSRCGATKPTMYTAKNWDSSAPKKKYFDELLRVSKNTIIWGANHFIENISHSNSSCWIVWDKQNGNNDFADCELAWTNYKSAVRKFEFRWAGMLQGYMKNKETRIHPTQKPVALYKWLLHNYAKQGDKILDTHLGSGSSRIAAYEMGFDFTAFELDTEYFEAQEKRYKAHIAQLKLELI